MNSRTALFNELFDHVREEQGMKKAQMAKAIGMTVPHLWRLRNQARGVGDTMLRRFAVAFPEYRTAIERLWIATEKELDTMTLYDLLEE